MKCCRIGIEAAAHPAFPCNGQAVHSQFFVLWCMPCAKAELQSFRASERRYLRVLCVILCFLFRFFFFSFSPSFLFIHFAGWRMRWRMAGLHQDHFQDRNRSEGGSFGVFQNKTNSRRHAAAAPVDCRARRNTRNNGTPSFRRTGRNTCT